MKFAAKIVAANWFVYYINLFKLPSLCKVLKPQKLMC